MTQRRRARRASSKVKRMRREARAWYFRYVILDGVRTSTARRTRYRSLDLERAKLACVRFAYLEAPAHAMVLDQQSGAIVFDVFRNGRTMSWKP